MLGCLCSQEDNQDEQAFRTPPFSNGGRMLDERVCGMGNWELDERGKNGIREKNERAFM